LVIAAWRFNRDARRCPGSVGVDGPGVTGIAGGASRAAKRQHHHSEHHHSQPELGEWLVPFIIVIVGAVIAIVAFNNSQGALATALEHDIPGYFKWAVAIAAILGLGYVPGFEKPSRWLMALVAIVVVLTQYQNIFAGFTGFAGSSGTATGSGAAEPTSTYVQSGGTTGVPTQSQIAGNPGTGSTPASATAATGSTGSTSTPAPLTAAQRLAADPLNPNSYIGLAAGFGGLA
jgi:hypothetical protein